MVRSSVPSGRNCRTPSSDPPLGPGAGEATTTPPSGRRTPLAIQAGNATIPPGAPPKDVSSEPSGRRRNIAAPDPVAQALRHLLDDDGAPVRLDHERPDLAAHVDVRASRSTCATPPD